MPDSSHRSPPFDFSGRTVLVSGAAGGIGAAVVDGLLAGGASVTRFDLALPTPAAGDPARILDVEGDATDFAAVEAAVAATAARFGGLDGLVNAAGVLWFGRDRSVLDIDLDLWDRVLDVNLKSMVHTCRAAAPLMKAAGGASMVHLSTIQCLRGDDRPQDAYQASKAGMIALSKSLAVQLGPDGVRSNVVCPGPTHTPMQARWDADPRGLEAVAAAAPLRRVGEARDIADACLFLLSDRAAWVTGIELPVDGGLLALP